MILGPIEWEGNVKRVCMSALLRGAFDYLSHAPENSILIQNFTNPFIAQSTIHYTLAEQIIVSIGIFDILGRGVETIDDSEKQAGEHQITWDARNKSSGVYLYVIRAEH